MITQADPKLTKADFDDEPWEQAIGEAKEPTCFEFCGPLKAKIDQSERAGKGRTEQIYTLLHAVASLCPSWSASTKPFRPAVDFGLAGRSASLDDFGSDEVSVLAHVAPTIKDPECRARAADVAWVLGRNYKMAVLAIPAYVDSAIRLDGAVQFPVFIERLQRAVQLALAVGHGDPSLLASVTSEIEKFIQKLASGETKWACADLMKLLIQAEAGDTTTYATTCETLALQAEGRQDWGVARTYWGCKAEWHRLAKHVEAQRDSCEKAAETYVGEADSALKRSAPSHGACVGLLMRAVEALRKIPDTRARVEELHQRILKEQELIIPNETTTHHTSTDISEIINETLAAFRSKPLKQVLLGLAMIGAPPVVAILRSSAEKSVQTNIWPQIVPTVYMNQKGKHLAGKPSVMKGNEESQDLCLKAEMMNQIKSHHGLMVSGRIKPALQIINSEHFVRVQDLEFLVRDNLFVPAGREAIFIRGLFAGLSGDFLIAANLLVPQVENSIRNLLYYYAGERRTSKLKDDLTQPERPLNELLYRDDVKRIIGEDLLFDLQSLLVEPGLGSNLRNELSHGLMEIDQFYGDEAIYAWWLIWRLCCFPNLMRMQGEVTKTDQPDHGAAASSDEQKAGEQLETFYRVLYTPNNTNAWIEKRYHSGHVSPFDWFETWERTHSTEPENYPLRCSTGYYSEAARAVFLKVANEGRISSLSKDESRAICELGGVCAYDTPEGAYAYLEPESPARKNRSDRYVEFLGEKLDDDLAEGKGAVIARVFKVVAEMLNREEFQERHQIQDM